MPKKYAIDEKSLPFQLVAMNNYRKQSLTGVPWNQLKLENIDILYLLSALKEPVQIDCKKAYSVMEQARISNSADIFVKLFALTHIMTLAFFYASWNTSENQTFPDIFWGHKKRPVPWNGLRVFSYSVTYFVTYLSKWRLFIQLNSFVKNEINLMLLFLI